MSDINTDAIAIVARLKAADLFTLGERTAQCEGLRLRDVIAFGEVTGGHVALWRALAKVVPVARVASILGWREDIIAKELRVPEARPTPAPVSEVRAKAKSAASKPAPPPPGLAKADVQKMIDAAVDAATATLRTRVAVLEKKVADLEWDWNADVRVREKVAVDHLARFGHYGEIARTIAKEHGVPVDILLSRGRTALVTRTRAEIVRVLTTDGMTQQEIATLLKLDHSSIHGLQQRTGVLPARVPNGRRLAA